MRKLQSPEYLPSPAGSKRMVTLLAASILENGVGILKEILKTKYLPNSENLSRKETEKDNSFNNE